MKSPKKVRLDQLIVERGYFRTRAQAQAAILAGEVYSADNLLSKPGHMVQPDISLTLRSRHPRYVSRGGYKMEGALKDFKLDVRQRHCLDVGSSTGGFTDCFLQQGAADVHCVDVGKGQLDIHLRQDPRVTVHEGLNARYLSPDLLPAPFDFIVVDVSFISLTKILPVLGPLLAPRSGKLLALIKPQFEVGPAAIGRGGIVKDKPAMESAITHVVDCLAKAGLVKLGLHPSRLKGMDGNQEFFLLAERTT